MARGMSDARKSDSSLNTAGAPALNNGTVFGISLFSERCGMTYLEVSIDAYLSWRIDLRMSVQHCDPPCERKPA
jgi:hypothetical protein